MWVLVLVALAATALAVRSWRTIRAMEPELRSLRARVRELSARLASVERSGATRSEPVANRAVLVAKRGADEDDPEADHDARGPRTVH